MERGHEVFQSAGYPANLRTPLNIYLIVIKCGTFSTSVSCRRLYVVITHYPWHHISTGMDLFLGIDLFLVCKYAMTYRN